MFRHRTCDVRPAVVDANDWVAVDVPRTVQAEWRGSLRLEDGHTSVIVLLRCTYEDGSVEFWALPEFAAYDLLGLLRDHFEGAP
jgi:hypothetical protein